MKSLTKELCGQGFCQFSLPHSARADEEKHLIIPTTRYAMSTQGRVCKGYRKCGRNAPPAALGDV